MNEIKQLIPCQGMCFARFEKPKGHFPSTVIMWALVESVGLTSVEGIVQFEKDGKLVLAPDCPGFLGYDEAIKGGFRDD